MSGTLNRTVYLCECQNMPQSAIVKDESRFRPWYPGDVGTVCEVCGKPVKAFDIDEMLTNEMKLITIGSLIVMLEDSPKSFYSRVKQVIGD